MSKRTRVIATILAAMTLTTAFVGCGKEKESKGDDEKQSITVWSHLKPAEVDKVREKAEAWGKDNNCDVTVVEDKADMQDAITALQSSKGPDLYFGLPHDNLGTYQKAGVLAEVKSGIINKDDYISDNIIDAVTIDGKQYAVPVAAECVALFYNKDKVAEAPKTMEDAIAIGKEKGFQFNVSDFYLTFGFLSANGGYVFKNNDGSVDTSDIGLGNEGALKGYQTLKKVIDEKLVPADITDDIAKAAFSEGKSALYISGPWAITDLQKGSAKFGVAELPTIDGKPMKPFMGVQCAFVNEKSEKKDTAFELLTYLNKEMQEDVISVGNRLPVLKSGKDSDAYKNNEYIQAFAKQSEVAIPMPNVKETAAMWTPGTNNLKALLNGSQSPEDTGKKIVDQMKEGIAQQ